MAPLSPNAKRLRTIIISFPVLVVTTAILYRRAYLGEEQRTIPRPDTVGSSLPSGTPSGETILGKKGTNTLGKAPWEEGAAGDKKDAFR